MLKRTHWLGSLELLSSVRNSCNERNIMLIIQLLIVVGFLGGLIGAYLATLEDEHPVTAIDILAGAVLGWWGMIFFTLLFGWPVWLVLYLLGYL